MGGNLSVRNEYHALLEGLNKQTAKPESVHHSTGLLKATETLSCRSVHEETPVNEGHNLFKSANATAS